MAVNVLNAIHTIIDLLYSDSEMDSYTTDKMKQVCDILSDVSAHEQLKDQGD